MDRLPDYINGFETLTGTCRGIRRAGSAALDLAYVAAGRMDGFWEMGLSKWDIAAGIVLVREAGGFVSDLQGGETFWDSGDIVTANPKCFKSLIQTLNR
jgi:myo-inositol-1(or 4)-monophosphatase